MLERYVAQVRLLVEVFPDIAEESAFALKGGTAINLFYRDMPRLSVDGDITRGSRMTTVLHALALSYGYWGERATPRPGIGHSCSTDSQRAKSASSCPWARFSCFTSSRTSAETGNRMSAW